MGAGTLSRLLDGFEVRQDPRLIVGYDKSDDASVYKINDDIAVINTTDFFPPIVDDPYMFGQIAATNSISDVYAMGGTPKLALNIMCVADGKMDDEVVQEILRGGYDKAYEAGVIITGGHTIKGAEPIYGLAVTGFVHPDKVLMNSSARPGDVLILTKKLGIGILTTAVKADLVDQPVIDRINRQMATLNKDARDVMMNYHVSSCTDVTGFSIMGHGLEMAEGSGCTIHLMANQIPYHPEAFEMADMGIIPAGAYRNRRYAEGKTELRGNVSRTMEDILYDPQTSGGLLIALPEAEAEACLRQMRTLIPEAAIVGYVTEMENKPLVVEG